MRAYNVRADIRANQPRLLDYVKNGGTYVVQYQTGDSPDPNAPRGSSSRRTRSISSRPRR